ncbi:MAG: translocation/assembly module TamB [Magnetococcales bacterium]|nr:translocation/assembly module TamB [Magnetococcales bacterium]
MTIQWKHFLWRPLVWLFHGVWLLVVLTGTLFGLLQTEQGRQHLAQTLSSHLSGEEQTVKIGQLQGVIPFDIQLDTLTLSDPTGPWLTLNHLQWSLSPQGLFGGEVLFKNLQADSMVFLRQPADSPSTPSHSTPEQGAFAPVIPSFLQLHHVKVKSLQLGEEILPGGATFSLDGFLRTETVGREQQLHVQIDAQRRDQKGTFLKLDASIPQHAPLSLTLKMQAQDSSGLLDALLQHSFGTVVLDVNGQGRTDLWQGQLTAQTSELGTLKTTLLLSGSLASISADLAGSVLPEATLLPKEIQPLLREETPFTARYRTLASGGFSLEHALNIPQGPTLVGTLEDQHGQNLLQGQWQVDLPRLEAVSHLLGMPLTGAAVVSVNLYGDSHSSGLAVKAHLDQITLPGFQVEKGDWQMTIDQDQPLSEGMHELAIRGGGHLGGLRWRDQPAWPDREMDLELKAFMPKADTLILHHLKATSSSLALEGSGEWNLNNLVGSMKIAATVAPLAHFKGVDPALAVLLGETHRWSARLDTVEEGKAIQLHALHLQGAKMVMDGNGYIDLNAHTTRLETTLTIADLAVLSQPLGTPIAGKLTARTTLTGALDDPKIEMTLSVADPSLANHRSERLAAVVNLAQTATHPEGVLQLNLTQDKETIQLVAPFRQMPSREILFNDATLTFPDGKLAGTLTLHPSSGLVWGRLDGRAGSLASLGRLINLPMAGEADLKLHLTADKATGSQGVKATAKATNLHYSGASVRSLTLEGEIAELTRPPQLTLQTHWTGASAGGVDSRMGSIEVKGPLTAPLTVAIQAQGESLTPFMLHAVAEIQQLGDPLQITLKEMSGTLNQQPLQLAGAVQLIMEPKKLTLTPMNLQWGQGTLKVQAKLDAKQVAGNLLLSIPVAQVLSLAGDPHAPWQGQILLTSQLDGTTKEPRIHSTLKLSDLKLNDLSGATIPSGELKAQATLKHGSLTADGSLTGLVKEPVHFSAHLPAALSLQPFALDFPENRALQAELHLVARLERLGEMFPMDQQIIKGHAKADVLWSGTLASPEMRGVLKVTDLRYENGLSGSVFDRGVLEVQAMGTLLKLVRLEVGDGEQGKLRGSGQLEIRPEVGFPWHLDLNIQKAVILRRDDLYARLSGNVSAKGNKNSADISGQLTSRKITYFLPESLGTSFDRLDVRELQTEEESDTPLPPQKKPFRTHLRLAVNLPGQVFVRGKGLDSEWQGHLDITGQAHSPVVIGTLLVKQGHFQAVGRQFNVTNSTIRFDGAVPISPLLDIQGVLSKKDMTARINLKGQPDSLQMELSSQPALPKEEILSRLLFDKKSDQISSLQAVQLLATIQSLRDGGPGIMDRINQAIGVDRLDFKQDEKGQPSVKAGKYIGKKSYLSVEKGSAQASGKVSMEYEIRPNVVIETEAGENKAGSLGIQWKKEY